MGLALEVDEVGNGAHDEEAAAKEEDILKGTLDLDVGRRDIDEEDGESAGDDADDAEQPHAAIAERDAVGTRDFGLGIAEPDTRDEHEDIHN